jgi:hypothetical protein
MPADSFSNFLGMTLQATGNNSNAWGTILNGSALGVLEKAIAGNTSHAVTGAATLDLSTNPPPAAQTQALEMFQAFTGALTANQLVKFPNLSKFWFISNQTSGNYQLLLQIGSGTIINIPQGTTKLVVCDGAGNLIRSDKDQVGEFVYNAVVSPGTLEAAGQSLLKTDFPDLYAKYSTIFGSVDGTHFTLPLLNDTGRFLRSRTGSVTVGTYQSNQNAAHTHTVIGAPGLGTLSTDTQGSHFHSAGIYDPAHAHPVTIPNSSGNTGGGGPFGNNAIPGNTSAASTGVHVTSSNGLDTTYSAGSHSHNVTGAPSIGSLGTASSGGSEARPEALAVIISIRY